MIRTFEILIGVGALERGLSDLKQRRNPVLVNREAARNPPASRKRWR